MVPLSRTDFRKSSLLFTGSFTKYVTVHAMSLCSFETEISASLMLLLQPGSFFLKGLRYMFLKHKIKADKIQSF